MKREVILSLIVAGVTGQAGQHPEEQRPQTLQELVACLEGDANASVAARAQSLAAKMFAGIGVKLEWHTYHACPMGPEQPVIISLVQPTSPNLKPGALAYAEPYEGTNISVFYDRVQKTVDSQTVPFLLAHVLVHEIAHIVEGSDQHADTGVMKRRWDRNDFFQMAQGPLAFTEEDLQLLRNGLEARTHRQPRRTGWTRVAWLEN